MCLSSWRDGQHCLGTTLPLHPILHQLMDPILINDQRGAELSVLHVLLQTLRNEKWLIRNTLHITCSAELLTGASAPLLCWQHGGHCPTRLLSELEALLWPIPSRVCPASLVHLQGPPEVCRASTHFSSVGDKGRNFTLDWQVVCILQAAEKNIQSGELGTAQGGHRWGPRSAKARQIPPVQSYPGLVKPCVLSTEVPAEV